MSTTEETIETEKVIDNLEEDNTLALLKARLAKKEDMPVKIVQEKKKSLKFGIIGTGQAGSRLAEQFYKLGYQTVVCNTATQDLSHIQVPEPNKLHLNYGFGGAAKELEIGKAAAESHRDAINEIVNLKLDESQLYVLAFSLGGGSGAGSAEIIADILVQTGKPVIAIAVLPMESEDAQTKSNSLETLKKVADLLKSDKIQNLILVDNAKIESILSDVSQLDFYNVANQAIVEPIEMFNVFTSQDSQMKALDTTEFVKLMVDGKGLSVFGSLEVHNYTDPTAIAEAILTNLNNNLLADGLDLKKSRYAGYIAIASEKVWQQIPKGSIGYANTLILEACGTPKALFQGQYVSSDNDDCIKIYSMFTGLELPMSRIEALKKESQELMSKATSKDAERIINLDFDTGKNATISAAQKIKDTIAQKSSTFGKFFGNSIDKRK